MAFDPDSKRTGNNPGGRLGWFRIIRWIIVIILLVLAFILIEHGRYLVGALVGVLALLGIVRLLFYRRRRQSFGSRTVGQPIRELLRGMARAEFDVAASTIGISSAQLQRDFDNGRSIAEIASAAGVSVDTVVNAIIADMSAKIDQAKTEGRVSSDLAAQAKSRLSMWVTRLVNGHKGEFRRHIA